MSRVDSKIEISKQYVLDICFLFSNIFICQKIMVCPHGQGGWGSANIIWTRGRVQFFEGVFYGLPLKYFNRITTEIKFREKILENMFKQNVPVLSSSSAFR